LNYKQYKKSIIFLFIIFSIPLFSQTKDCAITIDGLERTYLLHLPEKTASFNNLPLVFVFHGGGGTGKQIMKDSEFNKLSDKEKFIAVYPNGIDKGWNDGRDDKTEKEKYDDVKFISRLIDTLISEYKIDTARIFATGISNGGFFSFQLAYKLSNRFLAIAPVCANIPKVQKNFYKPEYPVSLLLINGTADPLVKYEGGKVGFDFAKARGYSLSTDESVEIFLKNNKITGTPKSEEIPNNNDDDECDAVKYTYTGGANNTEVVLIKIENGGHAWPGGKRHFPKKLVGNLCKDFKAADVIWDFFKSRKAR